MHSFIRLMTILSPILIAACAHKNTDSRVDGKFRIGTVKVVIPQSEAHSEIAAIIEESFRAVIAAYGPADSRLPIRNLTAKLRVPVHRKQAFGSLRKSQIRGKVFVEDGPAAHVLSFSDIEDPQDYWQASGSRDSGSFFSRRSTFTRLGRKLALDVVGRIRGARLSPNGRRAATDRKVLDRLNGGHRPDYVQPSADSSLFYRRSN